MEYSVMDIAKILIKMIKKTDKYDDWIEYIEDRPYNDLRYYISNQKLKDLGWSIDVDLMTGLQDLIQNNRKLNLIDLYKMEQEPNKTVFFGDWIHNVEKLQKEFINAEPFENIIIPNFLNSEYAEALYKLFPEDIENNTWYKYYNPIEVKYAFDNIQKLPDKLKNIFYLLSTKEISEKFSILSGIDGLENDPYLHGAGLHIHPRNGRLHLHLDYEKHPYLNKERRLNVILYLSKNWKKEWNGETQLWDKNMMKCVKKSYVEFNTAFIFKTNDISWHGLPEKISCPEGMFRKTIAYYYVSNISSEAKKEKIGNDGSGYRTKATFIKKPDDEYCEKIDKLYKIRPHRLIEQKDIDDINLIWD
jgi:Rps23 Pro-64 3,4-dihydroxylase Tpa1-like proline 4-hydroxylase